MLHVTYAAFLADPQRTVARALAHIGVDPCPPPASLRAAATATPRGHFQKTTDDRAICGGVVENWDELCRMFGACEQTKWMLEGIESGCRCDFIGCDAKWTSDADFPSAGASARVGGGGGGHVASSTSAKGAAGAAAAQAPRRSRRT